MRIGGDLISTLVTNHNIQITQVGRFSDYDELLHQMQLTQPQGAILRGTG